MEITCKSQYTTIVGRFLRKLQKCALQSNQNIKNLSGTTCVNIPVKHSTGPKHHIALLDYKDFTFPLLLRVCHSSAFYIEGRSDQFKSNLSLIARGSYSPSKYT